MQHTVRAARTGKIGTRELANIAYGAACARGRSLDKLFEALAWAAEPHICYFSEQNLANIAWVLLDGLYVENINSRLLVVATSSSY